MTEKTTEQKVHQLILQKLYFKVDDDQIFIDKQVFVEILLSDIIALAINRCNIGKAVRYRSKQYGKGVKSKNDLMVELQQIIDEFSSELDAYLVYLDCLELGFEEYEIINLVNYSLNLDTEFLQKKMHQLMMQSLWPRLSNEDALATGSTKEQLIDVFATNIRFIACSETFGYAVEEVFGFENYQKKHLLKKESIYNELNRLTPICANEINAYKRGLLLYHGEKAQIAAVLAMVRQLLNLE